MNTKTDLDTLIVLKYGQPGWTEAFFDNLPREIVIHYYEKLRPTDNKDLPEPWDSTNYELVEDLWLFTTRTRQFILNNILFLLRDYES